jgi:hypothetical protein
MKFGMSITGGKNMSIPPKLEYELEILTLEKNIDQFKQLGMQTEMLQCRLDYCRNQFDTLAKADAEKRIERDSKN